MSETPPEKGRSYAIIAIGCCFLVSALLRSESVAIGASAAIAQAAQPVVAIETTGAQARARDCNIDGVLDKLKSREAEFSRRENALTIREAELKAVENRLNQRLAALEAARAQLTRTVAIVDGAQQRDVDHLVTMYSTMKPKRAGALFDKMDIAFASELLARMKPEIAALILANMETEKAFIVSLSIARRNEGAPTR